MAGRIVEAQPSLNPAWAVLNKDRTVTYLAADTSNSVLRTGVPKVGSVAAPAAAGSDQAGATAMTAENNFVTAADDAKGVKLPTAVAGMQILVKNTVANKILKVYPASGGTINALSPDAAISMAAGTSAIFAASSATQWYTCPLVPS